MFKLLIFGGTNEGRRLWEFFENKAVIVHISVASSYGESLLNECKNGRIFMGKMDAKEIAELIKKEQYALVIDATHPYAIEVSKNIKEACLQTNANYLRLLRNLDAVQNFKYHSMGTALEYLKQTTGNILLTTGSKDLSKFIDDKEFLSRLYVRVLPDANVINQCLLYGLKGKQIIAMQGPFSEELNLALLNQIQGKYLVTKSSGQAGGFPEKVAAAKKANAELIVIGKTQTEDGFSEEEILSYLETLLTPPNFPKNQVPPDFKKWVQGEALLGYGATPHGLPKKEITLLGIGMGVGTLTEDAKKAILSADVIIGGERILSAVASFQKPSVNLISAEKIALFVEQNTQFAKIVVAFSGDVGFYSGARPLYPLLKNYVVKTIPGISAPVYFLAKLALPWQDVRLCSLHGNSLSGTGYILQNHKCFFLLGKPDDVSTLCKNLCEMNLGKTEIYVGERLSYPDERIVHGIAEDFCEQLFAPLSVLLSINAKAWRGSQQLGIADTAFIRNPSVPMSKREVRVISLSYLHLENSDVFYDIGAGSGSVSVEASFACSLGQVYAIEHKEEAVRLLYENKKNFACSNIHVVKGHAPQALEALPRPDKVFIGGSGGELSAILSVVLEKNPSVKIVINSITLETLTSIFSLFQKLGITFDEITEVSIAKGEKLGSYHMMKGQNPIFIISGQGGGKS